MKRTNDKEEILGSYSATKDVEIVLKLMMIRTLPNESKQNTKRIY